MRSALLPFALVPTIASADVPNVSADIAPVASLVSMVMGDLGAPTLLLAQGISPHDAAMRPSQAQALQDSDIVVWIGSGLTPFLDDSIPKLATDATSIILLELDAPETIEGGHDHSHGAHEDEHADEHDDHDDHDEHDEHDDKEEESHNIDAHAWLDPMNAVAWLDEIALRLSETDPENAATYAANASVAKADLIALNDQLAATLAPVQDVPFITYHDAFTYFTNHYGLSNEGALLDSDADQPSAAHLTELREHIEEDGIACVLTEPQFDTRLIATVFEGRDVTSNMFDILGSTLPLGADLYGDMLRAGADAIVGCKQS